MLFLSNTFISNTPTEKGDTPTLNMCYLKNFSLSSSTLSSQNNKKYSKKCTKINAPVLMRLLKMKNRSLRHDINRPRPRHGHKYVSNKICLSI